MGRQLPPASTPGQLRAKVGFISYLSKRTDTRSIATITDSLSGVAGLGSELLPGLSFSFPETNRSVLLCFEDCALNSQQFNKPWEML